MVFKDTWEKTQELLDLSPELLQRILLHAFPGHQVTPRVLSGGCANLNLHVQLDHQLEYLLRIYHRDKGAAIREQKIAHLVKGRIPTPGYLRIGCWEGHTYAVCDFVSGISLRELLLRHPEEDASTALHESAHLIARLREISFDHSGFFNDELIPMSPLSSEGFVDFMQQCLAEEDVLKCLGDSVVQQLSTLISEHRSHVPDFSQHTLVHGDFDPANLLVHPIDGIWRVAALLDWEFAFSGPWICDVATMLRYAKRISSAYEASFLQGLQEAGVHLPDHWRCTTDFANLASLLDCLCRGVHQRPRQAKDIQSLIGEILARLKKTS